MISKEIFLVFFCIHFFTINLVADNNITNREYLPETKEENELYKIIDKNIFPTIVADNLDYYKEVHVGWAGIIKGYSPNSGNVSINLLVEHRNFNWIEMVNNDKILLPISMYGDGEFVAECYSNNIQDIISNIHNGKIKYLIVYGTPSGFDGLTSLDFTVRKNNIHIDADYIRFLDSDLVIEEDCKDE
ncbi:hypothetical protein FACS189485_22770 [Spirochaetia bacterium]|nr:hypothetical protein FACS189485_22770 [Spirochaetia bacterium]